MNNPSNLPPGVTDKMIEDAQESRCEECGCELDEDFEDYPDICRSCNERLVKGEQEDQRLDDPRHGQASEINRSNKR